MTYVRLVVFTLIGKSIKIFEELDSTNNFVRLNAANLDNGAIIVAKKQTKGRGQRDNKWVSKEGNLYFSFILKKDLKRDSIFKYIVQSSLAIIRTLKHYNIDALIKYPNDCLVDHRKISGVLIESLGFNMLEHIIIGIGININQVNFGHLENKATSMKHKLNKDSDVERVLETFIENYNDILQNRYEELFNEYLKKSVVIGKEVTYEEEE
jgi:BirA family biotin operon repressor/biotin-[acetyl-CoA-carboxylase] ligase